MRLSKLIIKGFRSFNEEGSEFLINTDLSAFIGANSAGKTAALDALQKIFGNTIRDRELTIKDFHVAKSESQNVLERKLSIEAAFEFDDKNVSEIASFFAGMIVDSCGAKPYLRMRLEAVWRASEIVPDGEIEVQTYIITVPQGSAETDQTKQKFPSHLRPLIQVIYVPAIRQPNEQLKYASGSILHRVLKKVKWTDAFKTKFQEDFNSINDNFAQLEEFGVITKSINDSWGSFHKDERYKDVLLNFDTTDLDSILKKLELSFSPTEVKQPFKINELGDGYRSLFYLNLVKALLDIEDKLTQENDIGITRPLLTILAVEEPENHIAPQLLGRVISVLSKISSQKNAQVFLSSHTPAIVKRINPESIFHFRITKEYASQVNKIELPTSESEAYQYIKQAIQNYPELYFARLVVIGEGDSEAIIFNRLMQVMGVDFDDNLITFAPLGHRFVNHIWQLLETLHIPYITLLDLDVGREGGGWGRIKYILEQLIENGAKKSKLLLCDNNSVLSDNELSEMHTWDLTTELKTINGWVEYLKSYNVFYSNPLDLDFLMLEHYPDVYKDIIPENGGPRIPDKKEKPVEFDKKVEVAIQHTLKSEKATGPTYSPGQKEIMIWYDYLFLGRGKPTTHIQALASMTDDEIKKNLPQVFKDMFEKIKILLKDDV